MSATSINNQVAAVLASLPVNLEPTDLHNALALNHNNLDNVTLGHAYYTVYYNRQYAPLARPASSNLLTLYARRSPSPPPPSLEVVKQTDPRVYVASVCDTILPYDIPAPPQVFCQAIRNIHPHELKSEYYHNPEICGATFEEQLMMVNSRLHDHFLHNSNLDDVLNRINKCLCLRMLSSNMYYYRDNRAGLDPAIAKLLEFYTLTGFFHASSEEVFRAHLHMIHKFKQLKGLMEELVNPKFKKFLELSKYAFSEIEIEPDHFIIRLVDARGIFVLPAHTVHKLRSDVSKLLKRDINKVVPPRMSASDMFYKMEEYMHPSAARLAFDEGIRFIKVLMTRLDTEKDKNKIPELIRELGKLYEITLEQFINLIKNRENTPADDETIFRIMQKMDEYDAQYRAYSIRINPMREYLEKLRVQYPSSPRSSSPPRKRRRTNGGAKTHRKHKKTQKRKKSHKATKSTRK